MKTIEELKKERGSEYFQGFKGTDGVTPIPLAQKQVDKCKIDYTNPKQKILCAAAGHGTYAIILYWSFMGGLKSVILSEEKRSRHILQNMLYLNEINPWLCRNLKMMGFINIIEGDYLKIIIGMTFNLVIGNPPYKKGLHMKIFNKSFDLLNEGGVMSFIHPSTQFLNNKDSNKKVVKDIRNIINTYQCEINLFDGNEVFTSESFYTPLSLTIVKNKLKKEIKVNYNYSGNNDTKIYNNWGDIYIHASEYAKSIENKILSKKCKSIDKYIFRKGGLGNVYLLINRISGNKPKNGKINPDFYQLIYKENENNYNDLSTTNPIGKKNNNGALNELAFSNENELKNGFNFLLTKFARFCLSLRKTGPDINFIDMSLIPYLDFSQEWPDKKIYDYFNLTQEERDFIEDFIPDLYDRDFK